MANEFFGLPPQALSILMIVFGILIIVLPALLPWLVGILLIVAGVGWLVGSGNAPGGWWGARRGTADEPPRRV